MTKEEIEVQAEDYTNNRDCYVYDCEDNAIDITGNLRQAFQDGAKWGMEQICKTCEKRLKELDRPCAYRSLGNDYCWE